ncbi:protein NCBP2AS2 [Pungitius pungitius]|uniref:protein NCBP2AS2 n=1 Tax=Pungitius pungitius TaxID=134920 RepID=UPI00188892AF|nr:protein NCBP2AS2 [Pungitius pungitius]
MLARMLFNLLNNHRVVEKLAESRPIRRAAQITAYAITKAQIAGRDASQRVLRSQTLRQVRDEAGKVPGDLGEMGSRLKRVRETFVNEVKGGWKDGSRGIKK